jgi:hypothetical protein
VRRGGERQQAAEQVRVAGELFERGAITDAVAPAKNAIELIRSALRKTTRILTEINALSGAFPGVEMVPGMPGTWKGPGGSGSYRPLSG